MRAERGREPPNRRIGPSPKVRIPGSTGTVLTDWQPNIGYICRMIKPEVSGWKTPVFF
jgi:hypothetical protein